MKLTVSTENTLAIVVGIEKYADQKWPDLAGPAMDALRIANWLLEQGVVANRIALYVNMCEIADPVFNKAREDLLQDLLDRGIAPPCEPSKANLENALDPAYFQAPSNGQTGLLFVYFCGHGVCSSNKKERYALTADASTASLKAINIGNQADNLRIHAQSRAYPQQWIIHDACAQFLNGATQLRADKIDVPEQKETAKQYCLFATRPGEFAKTKKSQQSCDFSTELLKILHGTSLHQLDIEEVFNALEKAYAGIEKSQHPCVYRYGYDWSSRTMMPWASFKQDKRKALIAILKSQPYIDNLIYGIFQQITKTVDIPKGGIASLVHQLDDFIVEGEELDKVALFAIELAECCKEIAKKCNDGKQKTYQKTAKSLAQWIKVWLAGEFKSAVIKEQQRLAQTVSNSIPVILLQPFGKQEARAWCQIDGKWQTVISLKNAVDDTRTEYESFQTWLQTAIELLMKMRGVLLGLRPMIEIVLPFDKIFAPYCGLKIEPVPETLFQLGKDLPLIFRIEERWVERQWGAPWRKSWENIQALLHTRPYLSWDGEVSDQSNVTWGWLGSTEQDAKNIGNHVFCGQPFLVWCAQEDRNHVGINFSTWKYAEFHSKFRDLKNITSSGDRHINCIVDDPNRLPEGVLDWENPFSQPQ